MLNFQKHVRDGFLIYDENNKYVGRILEGCFIPGMERLQTQFLSIEELREIVEFADKQQE